MSLCCYRLHLLLHVYNVLLYSSIAVLLAYCFFFFFQAEDGIRDLTVTGVQTCALPIYALAEKDIHLVRPLVSQFGWQFEKRLYTNEQGLTALTEFVPLISGLEQGVALPSLNWLVGVRTASGTEFGIGPNITPVGVAFVVAEGITVH